MKMKTGKQGGKEMTRIEAAERLEVIAYEIYDRLGEMEDILWEVAPEELERARVYWMAHIDGALLNTKGRRGRSFINLGDTLTALEEAEFEEEFEDEEEVTEEGV